MATMSKDMREDFKNKMREQLSKNQSVPEKAEEEVKEAVEDLFASVVTPELEANQKMFSELFFDPKDIDAPDFPMDTFFHKHEEWPEEIVGLVPEPIDYQWNKEVVYSFCAAEGKHTQLTGQPGSGKTTLPQQVAARTGRPVIVQSFRQGLEEDDWLAKQEINSEGTFLTVLPLVKSMAYPCYAVMDEFNRMSRGGRLLFNGVLHDGGHLRLPNGDNVIPAEGWRCVTTDNTKGFGDGLDMFDGDVNDISTTDRFALMIEVPYLPHDQQVDMLVSSVPTLHRELAEMIVTFGSKVSEGFKDGLLPLPWTPRRAKAAGELTIHYRNCTKGLRDSYFAFLPEDSEKQLVNQILRDIGIADRFGGF